MRNLRNTVGSVDALPDRDLERLDAQTSENYLKMVPGVSLNKENADRSDPSIRGIATETRFQTTARATGIYFDDIPLSDPFIPISQPDLNPFDLARVEVLKGPQGTLFGSTALAGAIRYITQKPAPGHFHGKVAGSLSSVSEGDRQPFAAAMLNVPLGKSAALRGVTVYRRDPGYVDDLRMGEKDIGAIRQHHERVQGLWHVTDALQLAGTYLEQSSDQYDSPYADQRERLEHGNANGPSPMRSQFDVANLVASYDFTRARLLSSTSVQSKQADLKLEAARTLGVEQTGVPVYATADTHSQGFTQELRLTSPTSDGMWDWMIGAWYLQSEQQYDQVVPNPALGAQPPSLPLPLPLPLPVPGAAAEDLQLTTSHFHSRGTERAVFGDVTCKLGHLALTVGGRFYRTELQSHNVSRGLLILATSGMPEQVNDDALEEQGFNPRASISLHLSDRFMLYGLASKGFRFGGVQLLPPSLIQSGGGSQQSNTFKSDKLWNYELGARSEWFHRRLRFDAAAFYGSWQDLQITRIDSTGLFTFVQNIGAAHTQGVEISVEARPLGDLTLSSAAAFIDARTDEALQTADGDVPAHTRLPGTPGFQIANRIAYERRFRNWDPGISVIHSHIGRSPNNLFATEQLGGYDTLDLRAHVGLITFSLKPDLALAVTNLTDVRGVAGVYADPAVAAKDFYFVTPRTLSLTLSLTF